MGELVEITEGQLYISYILKCILGQNLKITTAVFLIHFERLGLFHPYS